MDLVRSPPPSLCVDQHRRTDSPPPSSPPARGWTKAGGGAGASGAAVMAASRAGTLNRMLDDDSDASDLEVDADPFDQEGGVRFKAIDLNDIGQAPGEEDEMTPLVLPRDPKVLRTKIKRLKERKGARAKREGAFQFSPLSRCPPRTDLLGLFPQPLSSPSVKAASRLTRPSLARPPATR